MLIPTNISDVPVYSPSQPLQLYETHSLGKNYGSLRKILHHDGNATPHQHFRPAGTRKNDKNQTPEDRLLHLDKHLRRSVFFEHVAR